MRTNSKAAKALTTTAAPVQAPPAGPVPTIQVKENLKLGGARGKWYARLQQFAGKPLAEFTASCESDRPSLPKSGTPEPVAGWVRYLTKTGVLTLIAPK